MKIKQLVKWFNLLQDEDVKSSKLLQRREHGFQYDAEINVQFDDFVQCQTICNFLTAKLDDNVWIVGPDFYHLPSSLEHLRYDIASAFGCA